MPLRKIRFKPGIDREGTQFSGGDPLTWWDCDKVRFRNGLPEQIGGWQEFPITVRFPVDHSSGQETTTYRGVCRSIFDWVTSTGYKHLGIGTNTKFYIEHGEYLYDITPLRVTTAAGDVTFAATNGSSSITVTDTAHGAVAGDYVTFSGAASLGGLVTADVLNHEYVIDSVTDADNYVITARSADQTEVTANASDTGNGGASVVGAYQINTGTNSYVASLGWGSGGFGGGGWGGGGSVAVSNQLRQWSQTEFGDDLIFNVRGGGIYYWDQSADWSTGDVDTVVVGTDYAVRGTVITNSSKYAETSDAPTIALQVMLSPQDKHLIAFGTNDISGGIFDPLLVRWSDEESAVVWTPAIDNSAGGQQLSSGNFIVGAIQTRQEILIFTDTSIHAMRFTGDSAVFQFEVISENVTMISPHAGVAAGDAVFFMHEEGFYVYRGSIQRLDCSVLDHVFNNVDKSQLFKVFADHNPNEHEVTWFYPTSGSPGEIDRYVAYNYTEDNWTIGTFARGAWAQTPTRTNPIASSNDLSNLNAQKLYYQEFGFDADGSAMGPYIESCLFSAEDGESFMYIDRFIPDFRYNGAAANAAITLTVKGVNFPQETPATKGTYSIDSSTKQVHTRCRARDVALRFDMTGLGYEWTMGQHRIDVRTDGRR